VKITTWNINGLRAAFNKGAWDWVRAHDPDIICLQEIKTHPQQLVEEQHCLFDGYDVVWHPAQRKGYSGVATFLRKPSFTGLDELKPSALPVSQVGLGMPDFDEEGRVIATKHPGFWLFNVYFPNGQRDRGRLLYKLDFYHQLLIQLDALHAAGEKAVICGDFNTAHKEIDLRNPRQNETTSGFLPEERVWIDRYISRGFVDAYRYLYPERIQYTWWTYRFGARERNIGWRIDYFMISESLTPLVKDVVIHDDVTGSDHCPVTLFI
jgi:exodeoxyribonuclease III